MCRAALLDRNVFNVLNEFMIDSIAQNLKESGLVTKINMIIDMTFVKLWKHRTNIGLKIMADGFQQRYRANFNPGAD